ncbi:MAG: hypothetical protein OXG35_32450 [Acidobacteria bacterium]|nr:hypothetical protein [Acidobacteriota bacterium]
MQARNRQTRARIERELVEAGCRNFRRDAGGRLAWESDGNGTAAAKDDEGRRLFVDEDGEHVPESDVELFDEDTEAERLHERRSARQRMECE